MELTKILARSLVDYKSNPILLTPPLVSAIVTLLMSDYYFSSLGVGMNEARSLTSVFYLLGALFGFILLLVIVGFLVMLGQISMTGKVILTGKTRLSDWRVGLRRYFWRTLGIGAVFVGILIAVIVPGTFVYLFLFILPAAASHQSTPAVSRELAGQPYFVLGTFFLMAVCTLIFYTCLAPAVLEEKGVGASIRSGFKALRKNGRSFLGFLVIYFLATLLLGSAILTSDLLANPQVGSLPVPSLLSTLVEALLSPVWYLTMFRMYSVSGVMLTLGTRTSPAPADTKVCSNCAARVPSSAKYCPNCGTAQADLK